eukprot:g14136.t1 g14136   contig9:1239077-1239518(-)
MGESSNNSVEAKVYATDLTEEMRSSAIKIAHDAFQAPVTHEKVYRQIADAIRIEFEKTWNNEAKEGEDVKSGISNVSAGWSCVVGDAFGSCVTHRQKTYIHFAVVPGVNILLWKS